MRIPLAPLLCVLAGVTFSSVAVGQDKDPYRFVPDGAAFVVSMDGPTRLGEIFGETDFGSILFDDQLMQPLGESLEQLMDEADAPDREGAYSPAELWGLIGEIVQEYRGRVVLAWKYRMSERGAGIDAASISLSSDGVTNLAGLLDIWRDHRAEIDGVAESRELGGRQVWTRKHELNPTQGADGIEVDEVAVLGDGSFALFVAESMEDGVAPILEREGRGAIQLESDDDLTPVWMEVDLSVIQQNLAVAADDDRSLTEGMNYAQRFFGVDQLQKLVLSARAVDKRVGLRAELLHSDRAFVLSDILGQTDLSEGGLIDLIPRDLESWTILSIKFDALLAWADVAIRDMRELDDSFRFEGESLAQELENLGDELGVDIANDIVGQLAGPIAWIDGTEVDGEIGRDVPPTVALDGQCLALSLENGKQFGAAVDALLRKQGLHAARRTRDYRGTPVHSFNVFVRVDYAITDSELLIGMGREGADLLRVMLDNAAARGQRGLRGFSAVTDARLANVPRPWHFVQSADLEAPTVISAAFRSGFLSAMRSDRDPRTLRMVEILTPLWHRMSELDLTSCVTCLSFEQDRIRAEIAW